ncbi:MAG: phosphoesterase [Acidobacteria bacterium]|nr:MAG: phosphoesterase [Acidobacteriota bacterium]
MYLLHSGSNKRRLRSSVCASLVACSLLLYTPVAFAAPQNGKVPGARETASPIKHVIIIVGENRSFDHVYATYVPHNNGEKVNNLLSEGIVNADGTPGPNFAQAQQFQVTTAPNNGKYFINALDAEKTLYATLPPPDLAGTPPVSALSFILQVPGGDPGLPAADQFLFGTGGTGLHVPSPFVGPDTRISNVNNLPPGPFQMTGPTMPYDAFTGDTIHQFFQMFQQVDCDGNRGTRANPTGCLHDLQSFTTTTYSTPPSGTPHDTGQTMAFFNVQQGDAPLFKQLADQFTMSGNYHQPVMGGTGPDSMYIGFADYVPFSGVNGNAAAPPANTIYNPDPQPGTLNLYTKRSVYFNCSDPSAPGIQPILTYLSSLPYSVDSKCDAGRFYPAVNHGQGFNPDGVPTNPATNIPPTNMRSIGDELNEKGISWIYYGGGYNLSVAHNPINGYCTICNPFEYESNFPAQRADHMRDVTDLFSDLKNGTLPAVSFVKPDGALDGHPNSSKLGLFEAFTTNIIDLAQSNPGQWASTAIFITVDEGGGYYDSGFIQALDFFGDGPRIPLLAISPFSRGGHIKHSYGDHASLVKFIERNWGLSPLSSRSRDNLPNPQFDENNPYVPHNMPALSDLFDMFNFRSDNARSDVDNP